MNMSTGKRARMLKVRKIEHRAAKARLSQANRDVSKLADVERRIANLQLGTGIGPGRHIGPTLRATGEMQQRLSDARDAITHSRVEVERRKCEQEKLRSNAHQREESAARLHDDAHRRAMQEMIRRQDANMPAIRKPHRMG